LRGGGAPDAIDLTPQQDRVDVDLDHHLQDAALALLIDEAVAPHELLRIIRQRGLELGHARRRGRWHRLAQLE
jgi:hypothetical protein